MVIKRILNRVLVFLTKYQFKKYGAGTKIDLLSSYFVSKKIITLGSHVFIGPEAYISAHLEIDDFVMIGPRLTVIGGNHAFGVKGQRNRFLKPDLNDIGRVVIGEDAWIGANVMILPNVEVGMGAVIAAGSIVNRSIPPFCLVAGNPAKVKKLIFSDDELRTHLKELSYSNAVTETIIQKRKAYCEKNSIPCQL